MATTSKTEAKNELQVAREAVATAQEKLHQLHHGFESMKKKREVELKALEYQLTLGRNGDEREVGHNKIAHHQSETAALIRAWRRDIDYASSELIERNCELRKIVNDLNEKEIDVFKETIDLNAVFKAYAFHRETFLSTTWSEFLVSIFRKPTQEELNQFDVLELP